MTTIHNLLKSGLFSLLLLFSYSANADDENLCAPFKDVDIDQSILSQMLQAAKNGDLYRVKPGSSKMGFCIGSPIGKVEAEFRDFKGGIALDNFMQQGTSLLRIDVNSLQADSVIIETMLKSESFLDSERYPSIIFVSTGIEWMSNGKGVLKGLLTMHGITKEIAFYVELITGKKNTGEQMVTIKATTTIQRSAFGMHTLSPMVDDRVSLCMSVDAYRFQAKQALSAVSTVVAHNHSTF